MDKFGTEIVKTVEKKMRNMFQLSIKVIVGFVLLILWFSVNWFVDNSWCFCPFSYRLTIVLCVLVRFTPLITKPLFPIFFHFK